MRSQLFFQTTTTTNATNPTHKPPTLDLFFVFPSYSPLLSDRIFLEFFLTVKPSRADAAASAAVTLDPQLAAVLPMDSGYLDAVA